jgi:hypothetical protein
MEVGVYYLAGPLDGVELVLESLHAPLGRPHLYGQPAHQSVMQVCLPFLGETKHHKKAGLKIPASRLKLNSLSDLASGSGPSIFRKSWIQIRLQRLRMPSKNFTFFLFVFCIIHNFLIHS